MVFRFPMEDVAIEVTQEKRRITGPIYQDEWNEINQQEFTLDVEDVAWFYVSGGNNICIKLYDGYSFAAVELFLNSSIYAAILHQRRILPLHGSCFSYMGNNIMLCGDSGAGKSSLTVAFCMSGSTFITDDVSPIFFNGPPAVLSQTDRVKLWDDALQQLSIDSKELTRIQEDVEKFYLPIEKSPASFFPLHSIFILQITAETKAASFEEIKGAEKLAHLRSQIYKAEILQGMPENDRLYFYQLTELCQVAKVIKIARPADVPILQLAKEMKALLNY